MTQANETTRQLEEGLFHYLSGYGRGQPQNLQQVIAYAGWRQCARAEVERRVRELTDWLDTETLVEIAEGRIDLIQVAQRALDAQ